MLTDILYGVSDLFYRAAAHFSPQLRAEDVQPKRFFESDETDTIVLVMKVEGGVVWCEDQRRKDQPTYVISLRKFLREYRQLHPADTAR